MASPPTFGPVTPHIHVVGAVIVADGEILCAKRGDGPLAGLWEFPGGKVEPGEEPSKALEREIVEELGCRVEVGAEVTTTTYPYEFATITLTTFWCALTDGTPQLTDHTEVRWLAPDRLHELPWAPADVPAVDLVAR
jgi:8-oxo-dGTP diphosphatase